MTNARTHLLLIEDDRETASYLAKGLSQEGHSVEQAANGQDGLFRATDGSFDLIILDRDIFAISPYEIGGTEVLLTLLGGKEVHRAEGFAG